VVGSDFRRVTEPAREGAKPPSNPSGNQSPRDSPTKPTPLTDERARAPRPRDRAPAIVHVNPGYVQDAKTVKAASPTLHENVKAGAITLTARPSIPGSPTCARSARPATRLIPFRVRC
jgi:hypothetical protein